MPTCDARGRGHRVHTVGEIGAEFVAKLDEGCVPEAYDAWFEAFRIGFDALEGVNGGDWVLEDELTSTVFQEVINFMQRGKSSYGANMAPQFCQVSRPRKLAGIVW